LIWPVWATTSLPAAVRQLKLLVAEVAGRVDLGVVGVGGCLVVVLDCDRDGLGLIER
jgi:hypothetical protein